MEIAPGHILVTGAGGQLGRCLKEVLAKRTIPCDFRTKMDLDITDHEQMSRALRGVTACINCAAYTHVDRAEAEQEKAFAINRDAVSQLAQLCAAQNIALVHLSTDYIYHNDLRTPIPEDAPASPVSVYARSKLEGERLALEHHEKTVIFRTSWVYSEYGHNFVKTMLRLSEKRESLRIVNDQIGSPTYARDLAGWITEILLDRKELINGVFNLSNTGEVSWYDFAKRIFAIAKRDIKLEPIQTAEYHARAERPLYSVLDLSKVQDKYGIEPRPWREALDECLRRILHA